MRTIPNRIDLIIGKKLKEIRVKKGVTQTDVANAFGITYTNIGGYEKGLITISVEMIYKYCAYFSIDILDIMPNVSFVKPNLKFVKANPQRVITQ